MLTKYCTLEQTQFDSNRELQLHVFAYAFSLITVGVGAGPTSDPI